VTRAAALLCGFIANCGALEACHGNKVPTASFLPKDCLSGGSKGISIAYFPNEKEPLFVVENLFGLFCSEGLVPRADDGKSIRWIKSSFAGKSLCIKFKLYAAPARAESTQEWSM
jgi:hypothetical protein